MSQGVSMLRNCLIATAAVLGLCAALPASAADAQRGHALHEKHCTACHGSEVYTRPDRRVTSLAGLRKQVNRCKHTLEVQWFDDDVEDVVAYLNQTYYRF
jgi:mono/diheme cytochrome c family protein